MKTLASGLHQLTHRVAINAPVDVCYRTWVDSVNLPRIMHRVLGMRYKPIDNAPSEITDAVDIERRMELFRQDILPKSQIKQWLLSGPGGKCYQVENTVTLDIPNHFFCTISTDLKDICAQSSVLFSRDSLNQFTLIEWQVSFWHSPYNGSMSRLAADVLESGDTFMQDCLQDFKAAVESGWLPAGSANHV